MENEEPTQEVRDYVRENRETLAYVLKHGEDETVRSLALAVLLRGSTERDREVVKREIDRLSKEEPA